MSELDERIRACFPYSTFRPGQLEFIREAIQAFEGGAKNVIVEAPTGTGKTPGIIAIARYFTRDFDNHQNDAQKALMLAANAREGISQAQAILAEHQAHMITSLKMLQDQYLRDDKLVQIMKGKGNYLCHSPSAMPGMSCNDHEAMFGGPCTKRRRACTYVQARTQAQLARLTLHNFDSFLAQVSLGQSFLPRAILSIDEAHGADDHLIRALSFQLSRETMEKLEIDTEWTSPSDVNDSQGVQAWCLKHDTSMTKKIAELTEEIVKLQNHSTGFLNGGQERQLAAMARRKGAIEDLKRRLSRFLSSVEKVPWAVEERDNGAFGFEPVRSSFFAKSALLDYGARRLFMSATIFDNGRRLMAALNLKKDETHYIRTACIFPLKNRPLVDLAVADTGKGAYESAKPRLFTAIEQILDHHKGVRGVIHCNSYDMAKDIKKNVHDRRLMFHEPTNREETVNAFMRGLSPDAVLVGVFLREGYDFKDDLARFQVLVRLPYAWPDKRVIMRDEMEGGYYEWLCAIDLVQTYGRGVRNETDYCTTYCLDNRLRRFIKRAGHMMPEWFLDAIKSPKDVGISIALPSTTRATDDDGFFEV